jgi:ADP-ribose pyrophosphatase
MSENSRPLAPWTVLDRREIFLVPGRITVSAHAVELHDGRRYEPYYRVDLNAQAWVIAETRDGRFVCQRQYKHGPQRVVLTLPGGIVEPGEDPAVAAGRELLEETGYRCTDWRRLGTFCRNNNQFGGDEHFVRASGGEWIQPPDPTTNLEDIETVLMTRDEIASAVARGDPAILGQMTGFLMLLWDRMPGTPV